ncbi:hypothetical protein Slin15195_G127620 [Septoria linicola]|uniref:Xylanolytic transcriptional activator regulatory domain-containing protein n=1 Tax=Septoria linicola TaxID=215465 RepID=A0A9Q9B8Q0_9PEZI|nr:hypothetical protein Slin15195_G127620 [Septoria linicola]
MDCVESDARSTAQEDISRSSILVDPTAQLATPLSIPRGHEDYLLSNSTLANLTPFPVGREVFANTASMSDYGFPDFFEQIMMPDVNNITHAQIQMPPDVSNFAQDINLDGMEFDFSFLASGLTRPPTPQGHHEEDPRADQDSDTSARLRSEAFKKSPWSWNHWIPERNHNAFTGQEEINVQQNGINADDQHVSPGIRRSMHCELDHEARDRMIRMATKIAHSKLAMPSFPSLQLLEDLIDVFLLQDSNAIDTFVHASSFASRETRTALLMAMVAAGARYVALPPVWKMGLVIQEVVRLALAEVFESDNSSTRDIQPLQTYLLWLDVGIWSGFRRKTEIASSFLQPAVTMLTWANAFTRSRYQDITPHQDDNEEELYQKWRAWIQQEGLKRLVVHTFLHDSQVAATHLKNRLVSPSQMLLAVPMTLDLWFAPNAQAWRNLWLLRNPPTQSTMPSLMDVFTNLGSLDALTGSVDKSLCILAACHALAHGVWPS